MRNTLVEARGNRTQSDVSNEIGISQNWNLGREHRASRLHARLPLTTKQALNIFFQIFF